ncbi:hypothetical protein CLNEO_21310 [Anaerotignum neopropionicum]|uniref:Uncharacterized protein n=1 Tax=Anaerotignum neopropionicum TaxID=36847 RepID=A0A136WD49_9FIRM|nr:hypothetical protein [Anaerotignum neopropionicum]KXL52435.1 hypothetical protein CLNEO_21310 [Anaerotignum neopropionicum]
MYFIITAVAAVLTTLFWYRLSEDKYQLSTLCFIYWGAALMWFVDHVIAFFMEGGEFFEITLDATMLGLTVVLSGFFLWVLMLLVKARKGTLKN